MAELSTILIDADIIKYRIASSCEGARWNWQGKLYKKKREANEAVLRDGGDKEDLLYQPQPEKRSTVSKTLISYIEEMVEPFFGYNHSFFLSSSGNFRYDVATIKEYKGNRAGLNKPHHFEYVTELIHKYYPTILSHPLLETDDEIARRHKGDGSTVVLSLDKDFLQLEGMNYNMNSRECKYVSKVDALRYFYTQVLTGDTADNIPGLFGVGGGSKLVKDLWKMEDEEEMINHCLAQYTKRVGSYAPLFMLENIKLLYLVRVEEDEVGWKRCFNIDEDYWRVIDAKG